MPKKPRPKVATALPRTRSLLDWLDNLQSPPADPRLPRLQPGQKLCILSLTFDAAQAWAREHGVLDDAVLLADIMDLRRVKKPLVVCLKDAHLRNDWLGWEYTFFAQKIPFVEPGRPNAV